MQLNLPKGGRIPGVRPGPTARIGLSQVNAGTKCINSLLIIASLLFIGDWRQLLANLAFLLVLSALAGVGRPMLHKIKPFLFICLIMLIIHSMFNPHNSTYFYFVGLEGLTYGATTALRLLCIIAAANFLLLTTETAGLVKWIESINPALGTVLGLVLSVLPYMQNQLSTTWEVQSARGLRHESYLDRFRAYIAVIVPVIVKSIIRAQFMAQLLYLRGHEFKTGPGFKMQRRDWLFTGCGMAYFITNLVISINIS